MNQKMICDQEVKEIRKLKKESKQKLSSIKNSNYKVNLEDNFRKKKENDSQIRRSQANHSHRILNEKEKQEVGRIQASLGNYKSNAEVKIARDKSKITQTIIRLKYEKSNYQKNPKNKDYFQTDMQEFRMDESMIEIFEKYVIQNNLRFFKMFARNKTVINRKNHIFPDSLNYPHGSNVLSISTQKQGLPFMPEFNSSNNQGINDGSNLQSKRSYFDFSNSFRNISSQSIQTKGQRCNCKRVNFFKYKLKIDNEESEDGFNFNPKKVDIKEITDKTEIIQFRIDFLKDSIQKDSVMDVKKNLEKALNNFLGQHKDLVVISIKDSQNENLKDWKIITKPVCNNFPKTSKRFIKVKQTTNIHEVSDDHEFDTRNIIKNTFLHDADCNNLYVKQLNNNVNMIIKRLFQKNEISYNKENIFILLNLQVPLKEEIFQKMSLKIKLRVVCMIFTKFVNQKNLSRICDKFFHEIDIENPAHLKRTLFR